mgnify:CR=1 FL=1
MMNELALIEGTQQQLEAALNTYNFLFLIDRNFDTSEKDELINFCQSIADQDTVFLVKGSRSAGMEEVVKGVTH